MKQFLDKENPLVARIDSYKQLLNIDAMNLEDAVNLADDKKMDYVLTAKIDGELSLIYYSRKDNLCQLFSRYGRVRTDLPVTDEIRAILEKSRINEFIGVGELFVRDESGIMPYTKSMSILRAPKSPEDELMIHVMVFDVLEIDSVKYEDKSLIERTKLVQKYFKGDLVEPVTIFSTPDVRAAWKEIVRKGSTWEGLVMVFKDGTRIKVKPLLSLDAIVVGVQRSQKDPNIMGALQLAFMTEEGIFVIDSMVGTGFSDLDRQEWMAWAEENRVDEKRNVIFVNPFSDPRIVEVIAREVMVKEGPGMTFDQTAGQWSYVDNFPVGTLRQPSFYRIREDKKPIPSDLRVEQVLSPQIKKSEFISSTFAVMEEGGTFIVSKDFGMLQKLAGQYDCPVLPIDKTQFSYFYLDNGNEFGFPIGSKVVSLTKGITGKVIGYEQTYCPHCNTEAIPVPSTKFPMFTLTYTCPDCGYYLERSDIDVRVLWDAPIDDQSLFASEVHPTEITRVAWLAASGVTPGKEQDIIVPSNQYYKQGLTKQDVYDYYTKAYADMQEYADQPAFIIMMTEQGPVLKRYADDQNPISLDAEHWDSLNTGRMLEVHRVIPTETTNFGWVDIDPREKTDFSYTKKITKALHDYLVDMAFVKAIDTYFSGNRGFYLVLSLTKPMNVDELRAILVSTLESFIADSPFDNLTTGVTRNPKGIRLDVSTLKRTGSIKMPYSLSYKTGLSVIPINISDIMAFNKENARIPGFQKSAYKDTDFSKLKGHTGRFAIQEHFTYKKGKAHFDLRLEVPVSITREK
jgi:predicted RNA-binding Zn-ribbon protein involved in translation (DUF1610 family)